MSDADNRTIPATPRRREAARRQGLGATAALPAWAASAGVAILLAPGWARSTIPAAADAFRAAVAAAASGGTADIPWPLTAGVVLPTLWLVAGSAAAGLAVRLAFDGFSWLPGRAAIDLRRIDPLGGLGRIFSRDTLLEIVGNAAALGVLVGAAAVAAQALLPLQSSGPWGDGAAAAATAWQASAWLVAGAGSVAVCQWGLARRRFERRIRMTPQELADEAKDMQADPRVRLFHQQRRRQPAASTAGTS